MRLYWIRHGQMDVSAKEMEDLKAVNRFFNQEAEGELSPRGRQEAQAVARYFDQHPVNVVYTSPLIRARQTADDTARTLGQQPQIVEQLGELRTGHLPEGSLVDWMQQSVRAVPFISDHLKQMTLGAILIPLYYVAWRSGRTEGGESRLELEGRIEQMFELLRRAHSPNARVALFAHGYLIFYLCLALTTPYHARLAVLRRPYIPNGSITEMELGPSGPPRLLSYGRTAHLAPWA